MLWELGGRALLWTSLQSLFYGFIPRYKGLSLGPDLPSHILSRLFHKARTRTGAQQALLFFSLSTHMVSMLSPFLSIGPDSLLLLQSCLNLVLLESCKEHVNS